MIYVKFLVKYSHESRINEVSKALYHKLVTNKFIHEIKKDHDNNLTKEEIGFIDSYLDKEIEDLNQHIDNEKCTKIKNIKVTSLILKIGITTKLTMNSFVR